jgi:hypothetical protein
MRDLKWEQKYEEFEEHMGMLEFGSTLYNWKHTQLSKGHDDLDAKIAKEIEENEGGSMWSDRKNTLKRCIAQKNCDMLCVKWDQQYAEFEEHAGMP